MNPNYFQNPNYGFPNHARPNFPFHHSLPPPPPLQPPQTTDPIINDLPAALSSLSNLISLSEQTLNSLPSIINQKNNSEAPNFVSCPYNPNHQMPPESLFLHSLRCPSPLFEDPISLVNSLHYRKTLNLKSPSKFEHMNGGNEFCLSLDSFYSEFFNCNFFYKDCPGVVELHTLDNSTKSFTLPACLTNECADESKGDFWCFDENEFTILPSDLWVCQRQVQSWVDCPSGYSYGVFCAVLRLNLVTGSDLRRWIIANSPRYGVVIDVYMRDHVYVLFRICLNAIRRETLSFCSEMNAKTSKGFNCPVFYRVFMWIASQLSILYGEMNAKCFSIHIFRQCILDVLNKVLVTLEGNVKEMSLEFNGNRDDTRDVKLQQSVEGSIECKVDTKVDELVEKEVIFVFQVAASVAALHERALLEAKIKGLRESKPLPRYQRMNDHSHISQRADEERKKRPNFRAIIDHDGLPRKQLSNQDANKIKTREELLAEERDYKRRRMSYRGKKLKRSTLEVMRDLIGEYMHEIEQAGGIGRFDYADDQEGKFRKPSTSPDFSTGIDKLRKSSSNLIETVEATGSRYQKKSCHDHDSRTTNSKDASDRDYEQRRKDHRREYERLRYQKQSQFDHSNRTLNSKDASDQDYERQGKHCQRTNSRDRLDRDYYSGSSQRHKSNGQSHEQSKRQNDMESNILKHHKKRSSKSNYHSYKPSYDGNSPSELDEKLDFRDRHLRNSDRTPSAKFQKRNAFEDRYDPAESHDTN